MAALKILRQRTEMNQPGHGHNQPMPLTADNYHAALLYLVIGGNGVAKEPDALIRRNQQNMGFNPQVLQSPRHIRAHLKLGHPGPDCSTGRIHGSRAIPAQSLIALHFRGQQ